MSAGIDPVPTNIVSKNLETSYLKLPICTALSLLRPTGRCLVVVFMQYNGDSRQNYVFGCPSVSNQLSKCYFTWTFAGLWLLRVTRFRSHSIFRLLEECHLARLIKRALRLLCDTSALTMKYNYDGSLYLRAYVRPWNLVYDFVPVFKRKAPFLSFGHVNCFSERINVTALCLGPCTSASALWKGHSVAWRISGVRPRSQVVHMFEQHQLQNCIMQHMRQLAMLSSWTIWELTQKPARPI
jgi:hypothetical protein